MCYTNLEGQVPELLLAPVPLRFQRAAGVAACAAGQALRGSCAPPRRCSPLICGCPRRSGNCVSGRRRNRSLHELAKGMEIAMSNTPFIANHPLIQHKVTLLRNKTTGSKQFRELISEITELMVYEATRDLPLCEVEVETPITVTKSSVLAGRKLAFVPILRAGLGMVDGALALVPAARVGHIGLYRGSRDPAPGGILLQAAGGYRRPGGHRAGSDAGHRAALPWTRSPKSSSGTPRASNSCASSPRRRG